MLVHWEIPDRCLHISSLWFRPVVEHMYGCDDLPLKIKFS